MSKIFQNLQIGLDESLEAKLGELYPNFTSYRILRQSVDARQRHNPHFVMTVEVAGPSETLNNPQFETRKINKSQTELQKSRPIIVGSGPAGLFAALRLVEAGVPCLLLERGSESSERIKGINQYWRYGQLDVRNNVCFGEGGAGLYSDGKLITRIKSPHIPYVMDRLVQFGAPAEIRYLSNPHVGSDKIRRVIPFLREFLKANGCEIRFNTRVASLMLQQKNCVGVRTEYAEEIRSPYVVLATGHSAEDILYDCLNQGVFMEGKSFAMGLRIEHPQELINKIQYRDAWEHPKLGSANYKLTHHDHQENIGVYSFCMCPGGYVLSSGTEADRTVCNGMSNFKRNSPFANSAIVVSIDHEKQFGSDLLGGMKFRELLERRAFQAIQSKNGTKELPSQRVSDFISGKETRDLRKGSSPSGALGVRLDQILPNWMRDHLIKGLEHFQKNMRGFIAEDALFYGVESRTSCPVRITRHSDSLESISHSGLFPCGEGAGYAGGITSAACDGIDIADKIIRSLES